MKKLSSLSLGTVPVFVRKKDGSKQLLDEYLEGLDKGESSYGILETYSPGVGNMLSIVMPQVAEFLSEQTQADLQELGFFVVQYIANQSVIESVETREKVKAVLASNAFLRFHLIDMFLEKSIQMFNNGALSAFQVARSRTESANFSNFKKVGDGYLHATVKSLSQEKLHRLTGYFINCGAEFNHIFGEINITMQDFKLLRRCLPDEAFQLRINDRVAIMTTLFHGRTNLNELRQKIDYMLVEMKCNPNQQHYRDGTLLHTILANESQECAELAIDRFMHHRAIVQFDFSAQDSYSQTSLMLAVKLRLTGPLKKLLELHSRGVDIGLDVADSSGRTPLMVAAAIGYAQGVQLLLEAGVNFLAKDNDGHDLHYYLDGNAKAIRSILESIHVHPDRHFQAPHNWLYSNDAASTPLTCSLSDERHQRILISKKTPHWALIESIIRHCLSSQQQSLANHISGQIRKIQKSGSDKTLLEHCIEQQKISQQHYRAFVGQKLLDTCALGDLDQVRILVEQAHADINFQDRHKRTPLHFCVARQKIVENKIKSINCKRTIEQCLAGHVEVFAFLLKQDRLDVKAENSSGNTAFKIMMREAKGGIQDKSTELDMQTALEQQKVYKAYLREMAEKKLPQKKLI